MQKIPKQVISLTDSKIKAFLRDLESNNPNGLKTDVRLTDGAGLNLLIRKSGSIIWRFDYPDQLLKKEIQCRLGCIRKLL